LVSARKREWLGSLAFTGGWFARRWPMLCRRSTTTRNAPSRSWAGWWHALTRFWLRIARCRAWPAIEATIRRSNLEATRRHPLQRQVQPLLQRGPLADGACPDNSLAPMRHLRHCQLDRPPADAGIRRLTSHIPQMCGRYASFLPAEALARLFGTVNPLPNLEPTWNMAPTRDAPIVRLSKEGERHLDALKWGLVPYFTKDLKKARKPINARSETIATSGMFREAFAKRRCLVPAPVYYEWRDDPEGKTPFAVARVDRTQPPSLASGRHGGRRRANGCRRSGPSLRTRTIC
jgi:hypothetical protein